MTPWASTDPYHVFYVRKPNAKLVYYGKWDTSGTTPQSSFNTTPAIKSVEPSTGAPGATVGLSGSNLLGLSAVSFNGTPATFTAVNVNYAYTTVPAGATTGIRRSATSNFGSFPFG